MIAPWRRRLRSMSTALSAAAAVLAVALAAAGARARRAVSYQPGGSTIVDALRQGAAVLAVAAVITALTVLGSIVLRRRMSAPPLRSRRRMSRRERVVAGIAALLALAAVMTARLVRGPQSGRATRKVAHPTGVRGSGAQSQWHLSSGAGAVLITVAVLIVVAAVLLVRARRRRPEPTADLPPAPTLLAEAAAGGRRALLAAPDARQAIIAAYLAMEQHLTEHGFLLARSRTAGEVLQEAAGRGYVNREAGTVLVRLFERARFSAAPLTAMDRQHALTALEVLAARVPR